MNIKCCDHRTPPPPQTHVHEFLGSVQLAELREDPHNHRFAGVTDQVIPIPGGHVHKLCTRTDFYEDHFHLINDTTGPAIPVGDNRHVHFVTGNTNVEEEHFHEFRFATLIENPIGN